MVKNFFLTSNTNFPFFQFAPITSCPNTTVPDEESLSDFYLGHLQILEGKITGGCWMHIGTHARKQDCEFEGPTHCIASLGPWQARKGGWPNPQEIQQREVKSSESGQEEHHAPVYAGSLLESRCGSWRMPRWTQASNEPFQKRR